MCERAGLDTLPDDVLFDILLCLSVVDILSLKQTCRVFHALGCSDYLWHRSIMPNLKIPLGITADVANSLPSGELQRIVIKAIKLEQNWRKPTSQIKRITPVLHDVDNVSIDDMRLLPGAQWLVTAQRNRPVGRLSTSISLWSLTNLADIHRSALIEVPGTYRDFAVCFCDQGDWETLVIGVAIGNQEYIQLYKVPVMDRAYSQHFVHAVPLFLRAVPRPPEIRGVIHEVSVHGDVVAATFATVEDAVTGNSDQLFLLNINSGAQQLVDSKFAGPFSHLSIRLSHGHIILIGILYQVFAMRIYELPSYISTYESGYESVARELHRGGLGPLVAESHLANLPSHPISDFVISDSVNIPARNLCPQLSLIAFHSRDGLCGQGHLVHFPADCLSMVGEVTSGLEHRPEIVLPEAFRVPPSTSVEIVKLGTEGYRAVWLEHNWETQEFRLMKLSAAVDKSKPNIGVILPPDPGLPFSPRECQSLAFDEVTGRLCLGLYTGDLYVLDFV